MFGGRNIPADIIPASAIPRGESSRDDVSVPQTVFELSRLKAGIPAFKLFQEVGLTNSGGASRRLIEQGGAYINGNRVDTFDQIVADGDLDDEGALVLRAGKKRFHKINVN